MLVLRTWVVGVSEVILHCNSAWNVLRNVRDLWFNLYPNSGKVASLVRNVHGNKSFQVCLLFTVILDVGYKSLINGPIVRGDMGRPADVESPWSWLTSKGSVDKQ